MNTKNLLDKIILIIIITAVPTKSFSLIDFEKIKKELDCINCNFEGKNLKGIDLRNLDTHYYYEYLKYFQNN